MNNKIAIIGAGSWATALAVSLARHRSDIYIWARRQEHVLEINREHKNSKYLPGIELPSRVFASNSLEDTLSGAKMTVMGVPSHSFRKVLKEIKPLLNSDTLIVNTAKGLEEDTLLRLSEVFKEEMGEKELYRYIVLSGPSHAEEVARDIPTAVVAASMSIESAQKVQDLFMDRCMRIYTNPDTIGVELGGALKNIIALGTGIADGLEFGDNTTAALITRGLAEITRLGINLGANPLTFNGLAGVGDLMVTCTSQHSRNRRAGREIGQGASLEQALETVNMVVEGVRTTRAAVKLAHKLDVEMPITEQMHKVLFENLSPRTAVINLMSRGGRHELEEAALSSVKFWTSEI
ncbi:MAG: NAD(P)H-dependent glycerol-3-phosphate dehydrogenase [Clostridiales bacterium]|nr:NAD(P)H-dependent glycerol-3-phosphate dehydrogenase [Clostridiales bacterium]MCF8023234.1 NAD(P)H-dependent glycerol-3-phosphate dehydrogenase [Clostridiales bacterium]